jgi:hypothetical protein
MGKNKPILCRIAACREALEDGNIWSFYLINDSDATFDSVVLKEIGYEWGDWGNSETTNVRITHLVPQAHVLIWRDDGSGAELRMDLTLLVRMGDREVSLLFEFPKLYRKTNLPLVDGLGKHGWQEIAEG